MPRSRVPIKGSIGKSILTGQKQTVVQQTIVQQVTKGATSGVGAVASTIWPLIQQIPVNVADLAALATPGLVVDTGSHIIARTLAVNAPLTIANPTGAGGNPTISLTTAALTKTDDTNVTVTLGGTPGSALVAATSLTLGWTGQLAVPRGGSGAATLTGYLKGNGTSPFTANATIPATDITGLATVATTGAYSDLSGAPSLAAIATSGSASDLASGTVPSARLPTASTSVLGAVKVDGTTITITGGVISSTGGGGTGANPTASVGLAAVNGTAATFLRSDGAPALDQGIVPTWTGRHTYSIGIQITGTNNAATANTTCVDFSSGVGRLFTFGPNTTDISGTELFAVSSDGSVFKDLLKTAQSGGAFTSVTIGNSADLPTFIVASLHAAISNFVDADVNIYASAVGAGTKFGRIAPSVAVPLQLGVSGTPLQGYGPVSAGYIDMTPDASTFTGTLTGMTATVTNTCRWSRNGNQVTLVIGAATGTSNSTAFTLTGLPASIQPAHTQQLAVSPIAVFTNSGANVPGGAQVTASSGTITFYTTAGPWGATLAKGVASDFTVTYLLN